ncbi:hypothetical protein [Salinarimonas sp.]|uniref:hypothetical protein n=1 Tax=Salinarimonas sp. TaxID=2766526 RepID=UPI0032D8C664
MSATDADMIEVGEPLPRIAAVTPERGRRITVNWAGGGRRTVDLAPLIFTYRFYRRLRDDDALFASVHPTDGGAAIAWGADDAIDMDASSVARLAEETMEPADFVAFMKRHGLTYDAAAAQLGISRRLVAYYAAEREAPRPIALACAYLDSVLPTRDGASA